MPTIITENDVSQWSDKTGEEYHFPAKYLQFLQKGTKVIYYKGRIKDQRFRNYRLSPHPHYFGIAQVGKVKEAQEKGYIAEILEYHKFDIPVLAKKDKSYIEIIPANRISNYWRDGVRQVSEEVYSKIISNWSSVKTGAFSSNELFSQKKIDLINEYSDQPVPFYCEKCGGNKVFEANKKLIEDLRIANEQLQIALNYVPVITTHSPLKWDYDIIGMATGQTTTGTGVISKFTSTFTDLVGGQSERYNAKLRAGEKLCLDQVRTQAIEMGGNAVIATDIDYSEVGGGKGMLMVCMSGTVIKLRNIEVMGEKSKYLQSVNDLYYRAKHLSSLSSAY